MSTIPHGEPSARSAVQPVPNPEFAVVRRGYDIDSVQDYVAQAAAELSRLADDNWNLRRELEAVRSALKKAQALSADQVLIDLQAELAVAMSRLDQVDRSSD